jgi:GGDEF domain-containing protein
MRTAPAVLPAASTDQASDVFVLHPAHRPGARLALTGLDLLRLKAVPDRFAAASGQDELLAVAETLSGKLGRYFAGLK